jgi:hypothetical protein
MIWRCPAGHSLSSLREERVVGVERVTRYWIAPLCHRARCSACQSSK